jgi:hypothetical protein
MPMSLQWDLSCERISRLAISEVDVKHSHVSQERQDTEFQVAGLAGWREAIDQAIMTTFVFIMILPDDTSRYVLHLIVKPGESIGLPLSNSFLQRSILQAGAHFRLNQNISFEKKLKE